MYNVYIDGASRGNPGLAGIGIVIVQPKLHKKIMQYREFIGIATNNQAEYKALIKALKLLRDLGASRAKIFSDSQLLVKQLRGEYKVRNPELKKLFNEVKKREKFFESIEYKHIPREKNYHADRLANEAIDKR